MKLFQKVVALLTIVSPQVNAIYLWCGYVRLTLLHDGFAVYLLIVFSVISDNMHYMFIGIMHNIFPLYKYVTCSDINSLHL